MANRAALGLVAGALDIRAAGEVPSDHGAAGLSPRRIVAIFTESGVVRNAVPKTLLCLTPGYLRYASDEAYRALRERVRMVLICYEDDRIEEPLLSRFDRVARTDGVLNQNVRPVLDMEQVAAVVAQEVERAGSPSAVRVFCQEECHVTLAAQMRARFGIPGDRPELVERFRDKLKMKDAVAAAGIDLPRYEVVDAARLTAEPQQYFADLAGRLGTPLVMKPTAAGGSLNVFIASDEASFVQAAHAISRSAFEFVYEVDEFIDGQLYQCDSFTRDGRVVFCSPLEVGCNNAEFVQGQHPLSVYPGIDAALRRRLQEFNQNIITSLGFEDGATHLEVFHNQQSDRLVFLEVAARVPGGIGVLFHERNAAINLIDANFYLAVAPELLDSIRIEPKNNVVSALLPMARGTIVRLNEPELESPYEICWNVTPGMRVDLRSLADNAGTLTLWNDDSAVLRRDYERLQSYIAIECQ